MKKFFVIIFILLSVIKESHALPSRYNLYELGRAASVKNRWSFVILGAMESNCLTQNLGVNSAEWLDEKILHV